MRTFDSVEETSTMLAKIELTNTTHELMLSLTLSCSEFPDYLRHEQTLTPYLGTLCLKHEDNELVILSTAGARIRAIPQVLTYLTGFNFGPTFLRLKRQVQAKAGASVAEEIELPDSTLECIRSQATIYFSPESEAQQA